MNSTHEFFYLTRLYAGLSSSPAESAVELFGAKLCKEVAREVHVAFVASSKFAECIEKLQFTRKVLNMRRWYELRFPMWAKS